MSDLLLSRQPRSILVLPPLDRTAEASATYGAYSSVTFPLAESGYYVFPVAPVNATLRRHGLRTPVEIHRAPLSKLVEIFDPDAVLYLTVTHLGVNYMVLNTSTTISMTGRLVDADTGALLWRGKETFEQNTNTGYGDLSLMLLQALASLNASINSDISRSLAQSANRKLLRGRQNGWILGPYHPEVEKDLNEAELARGARPR